METATQTTAYVFLVKKLFSNLFLLLSTINTKTVSFSPLSYKKKNRATRNKSHFMRENSHIFGSVKMLLVLNTNTLKEYQTDIPVCILHYEC